MFTRPLVFRINGKQAGLDSLVRAGISGLTAGIFAGGSNGFANIMVQESKELALRVVAGSLSAFIFATYNFVSDAIINLFM